MRWLSWILLLPLAVAVIVFSVSNRAVTRVDFWPFGLAVDLPVFAVVLASLLLGFMLGGIVAWLSNAKARSRARAAAREAAEARRELAVLRRETGRRDAGGAGPSQSSRGGFLPPADAA